MEKSTLLAHQLLDNAQEEAIHSGPEQAVASPKHSPIWLLALAILILNRSLENSV